jgi:peptidoglycan/LPS O-acetylase OafA/YrhL
LCDSILAAAHALAASADLGITLVKASRIRPLLQVMEQGARELWVRPRGQMPALDGLRATAVLLVICSHYVVFWRRELGWPVPAAASLPIFHWGWVGVDLFFVLSGFLIGRQLWQERERTGTVRFTRFILRRGFRIWPLYFVMMAFYLLVGPVRPNEWDFAFLSNYGNGAFNRGWSLSTEEQFYIIVPILLLATPWVQRLARYGWVLLAAVVGETIARWVTWRSLTAQGFDAVAIGDMMYYPFHLHGSALVFGLGIALVATRRPKLFAPQPGAFSRAGLAIFIAASTVGIALRNANKFVFAFLALALIFSSLTLWLLWDRSIVTRPASWRILYPISRLSYGMYLNHFFVLPGATAWGIVALRDAGLPTLAVFFGGLVWGTLVSAAVAFVTFVLVEHPFLALREVLLGSPKEGRGHGPAPARRTVPVRKPVAAPAIVRGIPTALRADELHVPLTPTRGADLPPRGDGSTRVAPPAAGQVELPE